MRQWIGIALLCGCSFHAPAALQDAPADMPVDVPVDVPTTQRVTDGLIGFWTFNDQAGASQALDSANTATPVHLNIETSVAGMIFEPMFAAGSVSTNTRSRMISEFSTHLPADCMSAGAVTLEAWVKPELAMQGDAGTPRFIAGLAASVSSRDVVLLQVGDKWGARVRTNANPDGTPTLLSTSTADPTKYTHVVVVADQNQRTLYIDDVAEATDPLVGGPASWDLTSRLGVFDEPQGGRFWLGSIHIVALYRRGLLPVEVDQNFQLGPAAP